MNGGDANRWRLNSLFSLSVVVLVFVLFHWGFWYYLALDFDAQKVLAEAATGGIIGALYGLLPTLNKRFLQFKVRSVLASARFLKISSGLALCMVVMGAVVNRTEVKWPSGQPDIELDGRKILSDNWTESAANSSSTYGLVFQTKTLTVGDFSQQLRFRPLVPLTYDVPEAAVFSSKPEYQQIVTLLALTFFQSTENKFLADAKERFSSDQSRKFNDLNAVYQLLTLCFNGKDLARSGDKLLATFELERAKSSWIPLLRSCLHYSRGEFQTAAADIQELPPNVRSPLLDAFFFFRGVNHLKSFISGSNGTGVRDTELLRKSRQDFTRAESTSSMSPDPYFKQIAFRSAQIFQGISYVYEHENDKAFERFTEAAKSDYPDLRARSLSDLGYVSLLRGNLDDAEAYFVRALEADSTFPYARTNLGYAYLAQGRYDAARDLFSKLAQDEYLKRYSQRDIILSELALAHIEAERDGARATPNPDAYTAPLKEMGIFDYQGMAPPLLRLAKIRLALADQIYMSHDYYGLEMFALAMYARAFNEAQSIEGNQQASAAATAALSAFKTVSATVDARCFIFHTDRGFFKPVADLAKQQGLVN